MLNVYIFMVIIISSGNLDSLKLCSVKLLCDCFMVSSTWNTTHTGTKYVSEGDTMEDIDQMLGFHTFQMLSVELVSRHFTPGLSLTT